MDLSLVCRTRVLRSVVNCLTAVLFATSVAGCRRAANPPPSGSGPARPEVLNSRAPAETPELPPTAATSPAPPEALPPRTRLVYLINPEREASDERGAQSVAAAVQRLVDVPYRIDHISECSAQVLAKLRPAAVIISGQGTPWWVYRPQELAGVTDLIRAVDCPTLGICGGHQLLAIALGGKVAPIKGEPAGRTSYEGFFRERGALQVRRRLDDPLFDGVEQQPRLWLNHREEVKELPPDFITLAENSTCPVQAMRHETAPVYGVQFHPETHWSECPSGRAILANFLHLAGLSAGGTKAEASAH